MFLPLASNGTPWDQIPEVRLVGLVLGAGFLYFAIRSWFGKKK